MRARVKICGLTRPDDVEAAIRCGAFALGFIVEAHSPRRLSVRQAAELALPAYGFAKRVAVTVNPDDDLITRITNHMRPDFIQLHGDESPARAKAVKTASGSFIIKAISIRDKTDLERLCLYEGAADYILLDAKPPAGQAVRGGHGLSFDWGVLKGVKTNTPLILAGGLGPHNIEAAQATGIDFFDLSSGVELRAGVKDPLKIKTLMDKLA